jgi:hypothetical protein
MRPEIPTPPVRRGVHGPAVATAAWLLICVHAMPLDAWASKRTSGVFLQAEVPPKLRAGEAITLKLQVGGVTAADGASIEVRRAGQRDVLFATRLRKGEQRTFEIPYVASADSLQHVDVFTRQGNRSSVQSIEIPVGSARMLATSEGVRRTTPTGEVVISLPARSVP